MKRSQLARIQQQIHRNQAQIDAYKAQIVAAERETALLLAESRRMDYQDALDGKEPWRQPALRAQGLVA